MGVVSKGDMRYLFGIVVLEYLCSGGEGLFRGAEREFDGDYFHFGEIDGFYFFVSGRASGGGEEPDIAVYERAVECCVDEVFGRDRFGVVDRG